MNKLKLFMLTLALPLLMNCGGGGEKANGDVAVTPVEDTTMNTSNNTTLFKDNTISDVTVVKVFDSYSINIDMTEIKMNGEYLFLKIIDKDKKALFLGQVVHQGNLKLPLTIVADSFPLLVELYSESKEDKTISYEVYYD